MASTSDNSKEVFVRKPELDGLRGLAILMVMAYHYLSEPLSAGGSGWALALGKGLRLFWSGVDMFFVLSGFLIGGILLRHRHAANLFQVFFIRRSCRIWPLYYLVLVLFVMLRHQETAGAGAAAWDTGAVPQWTYFVFLQNVWMSIHHEFGAALLTVSWSLAVEEQFYLILPFMVRFLDDRRLVYASCAGILGAVLLRMFNNHEFFVFVSAPTRADSVLVGLLLAMAMRSESCRTFLNTHRAFLLLLLVGGGVGMACLTMNDQIVGAGIYLWTALFYATLLCLASLGWPRVLFRLLANPVLRFTGVISFGVYLFHVPVAWFVHRWLGHPSARPDQLPKFFMAVGASMALTYIISTVSYYLFERHFVNLGHRLSYQPKISG